MEQRHSVSIDRIVKCCLLPTHKNMYQNKKYITSLIPNINSNKITESIALSKKIEYVPGAGDVSNAAALPAAPSLGAQVSAPVSVPRAPTSVISQELIIHSDDDNDHDRDEKKAMMITMLVLLVLQYHVLYIITFSLCCFYTNCQ